LGEHNIVLGRKFSRSQLLAYNANLPASLIGLEACTGSHFIGSVLHEQGHQVRLIPAQFVKPYRKSNKNDFIDAEAIAEAITRQNMRFVADQDARATRLAGHAPRARPVGAASHDADQRDPRLSFPPPLDCSFVFFFAPQTFGINLSLVVVSPVETIAGGLDYFRA
jgi:transposase